MKGKRDLIEASIVAALQKIGCSIDYAERKPYDLVVGRWEKTYLLEIKGKKGTLTASQRKFIARWRGHYEVVRSAAEALQVVGL